MIYLLIALWMLAGGLSTYRFEYRLNEALNLKYPRVAKPFEVNLPLLAYGAVTGLFSVLAHLVVRPRLFGPLEV